MSLLWKGQIMNIKRAWEKRVRLYNKSCKVHQQASDVLRLADAEEAKGNEYQVKATMCGGCPSFTTPAIYLHKASKHHCDAKTFQLLAQIIETEAASINNKGYLLFVEAVFKAFGDIKINWADAGRRPFGCNFVVGETAVSAPPRRQFFVDEHGKAEVEVCSI